MKKLTFLTFLAFFVTSSTCFGQFLLSKTKSKFGAIRGSIGVFGDDFNDISGEGFLSLIKSNQDYDFNINEYRDGDYYAALSGGNIGLEAVFNPIGLDGELKTKQEIRVGVSANIAREAMLDVERLDGRRDYVTLCIIENEFIVQGAYIFKAPYFDGILDVYAGPGVSVGSTFGNEFIFLGGPEQTLEAKNSNYFRGSLIAGGSINLQNFFYQIEGAYGLGAQVVHDGKANSFSTYNMKLVLGYWF